MSDLLPGELAYIFFVSILDAALLSWLALLWYRRSVRRLMRQRAPGSDVPGAPVTPPAQQATDAGAAESLGFALFEPAQSASTSPTARIERTALGRLAVAYSVGAALHSAVITLFQLGPDAHTLPLVAWFSQWWINGWAIVPTLVALLVLDRGASVRFAVWYAVGGSIAMASITLAGQILRGTLNGAPLTNVFWMVAGLVWTAAPPLVLLMITAWRRVRAVMPVALAATLLFGFGSMFFREALVRAFDVKSIRSAFLDLAVLTSSQAAQYGLFMLASLPVGWLAWRLLRGLAAGFERKRFSDVQLVIDCWWVVVTAEEVATMLSTTYGLRGIGAGLAAFVAYRLGVALVLTGTRQVDPQPRRLLLLRVFGYQARTETLFDRVAQRWRFHGPVQLIAGVDLATRTADPGDILSFVNGHLDDQYITTADDVARRVERLDLGSDPDGRFRVNEVYCHDDTWRLTLEALLDASDTVLMDLRSFSQQNAGCIFELEQLVRRVPTEQIVLVCDRTTDLRLLGAILAKAWTGARGEGRARGAGQVALVRVEQQSPRELGVLMQRLLGIGEPQRVLSASEALPA